MSHSDAVSQKAQGLSGTPTRPFTLRCLSSSPLHSFSLSNSVCFDLLQKSTVHHFHDICQSSNQRGKACRQQSSIKPAASQWLTGNVRDSNEKKQADNESIDFKKLQEACGNHVSATLRRISYNSSQLNLQCHSKINHILHEM